ncbi:MAG: sulfatase-like hydrolase/transferase [Paludibacter sp.]
MNVDFRLDNSYLWKYYLAVIKNILILFMLFMLTRVVFMYYNAKYFQNINQDDWFLLLKGSIQFDLSGILYVNSLYILLVFFPLPVSWRSSNIFRKLIQWIFVITNGFALILNIIDTIYFEFSQRRTTWSIIHEFSHTNNLLKVFVDAMLDNWLLVLLGLCFFPFLYLTFYSTKIKIKNYQPWKYWLITVLFFLIAISSTVIGIRGGVGRYVRPITISNANQYVNKPIESSFVLNTPFTVIRTIENNSLPQFSYFKNLAEPERIQSTAYYPHYKGQMKKLNVVVLIMESFGREYIGSLNKDLIGSDYKGYTPFLDSIIGKSLTFETTIANGRKSIDALPSILASIPRIGEPYFVGDYGNNQVLSLAGDLKKKGYYSAFFHGAPNGSMGFWAFAKTSGFNDYFGMNEYGRSKDFDGTWAIWDEPFFQYFADKMNTFHEPFVTAMFSASSHHPYVVPEEYKSQLKDGTLPIHKCVRYTDLSLKHFFEKASKMPWFKRTLFVITADHTNATDQPLYQNDIGLHAVPIVFYYPAGIAPEYRKEIAQQIDIKPSVLGFLGYDLPYVAFGTDVFHRKAKDAFGTDDENGVYSFYSNEYLFQFNGEKATALYNYKQDRMQKLNLLNKDIKQAGKMELQLKAILQTYQRRMKENDLTVKVHN